MEENMATIRPILHDRFLGNPWDAFRQLQDEMSRFVGDLYSEVSSGYPLINIFYNDEQAVLLAELPGVKNEDLDISTVGRNLTLQGERKEGHDKDKLKILRQERTYGSFSRSVQLPFEVDGENIKASLKNGILKILLPRKKEELPRKVTIATD